MSLGRGLESLIPKRQLDIKSPSKDAVVLPERDEFQLDSQPRSSDLPIGNPARSVSMPDRQAGGTFSPTVVPQRTFDARPSSFSPRKEVRRYAGTDQRKVHHESVFQIEVDKIFPNPYQPRRDFKDEELRELAQSIREFGVIQPVIVTKVVEETERGAEVEYQLVTGERRLMAAKLVGLQRVPAIVRQIDEKRMKLEIALIENLQRSDLSPLEAARAYSRLQEEFGMTQREIAMRVGKSREAIANTIRLLNLPSEIQTAMDESRINESQARTLLAVADVEAQMKLFDGLIRRKTTVRELQEKIGAEKNPEDSYWEKRLEEKLGAPVRLVKQGNRGKMIVQFYSDEELRAILDKLLGEEKF